MKKTLSLILSFLMIVSVLSTLPLSAFAYTEGDFAYSVSAGKATITGYNGTAEKLEIPSTLGEKPVVAIGDSVFDANQSLKKVIIPEGITKIGDCAFYHCENLERIDIPVSVTNIEGGAFTGCSSLKRAFIRGAVTTIKYNTFNGCMSLEAVSFPTSLTKIGEDAFRNCENLKNIYYAGSIGDYNDDIEFSEGNTCLFGAQFNGDSSAGNCGDDAYYVVDLLQKILRIKGTGATDSYPLEYPGFYAYKDDIFGVFVEEGITIIGDCLFYGIDSMIGVTLPESLNEIGKSAFNKCHKLLGITIPRNVKKVNSLAFAECDNLSKINIYSYDLKNEAMFQALATIYACKGSTAEKFAKDYSYEFIAIGHNWSEWNYLDYETAPTCTKFGTTALRYHECVVCGRSETEGGYPIQPNGHVLGKGVISKYPTPTEKGLVMFTCEECGAKVTKDVAKCDKYANPLTVNVKKPSVKFSNLKKKNQTIALKSWATVSKAQGKVTYNKSSGNKNISINSKTGKITVKKGLKKGSYKIKIKVTAAGNGTYKAISKTVTVTVKVK